MRSIRLGRVAGIQVGFHWSLLVIMGLLALGLTGGQGDPWLWAVAIATVVVFFASLLAHEIAHSVIARRNGMKVQGITLWLLGGVAQLGGQMPNAGAALRIAAAGPAMSLSLGAAFLGVFAALGALGASTLVLSAFAWLALVNGVLAVFNLIPAAPLDGGRILAALLWRLHGDRTRADVAATRAGQVVGVALIAGGVVGTFLAIPFLSLWTALIGWFVFNAAGAERRYALTVGALGDRRVREAMTPDPQTVRGWQTVDAFAHDAQLVPPRHRVLPVQLWDGSIGGVVTLDALSRVAADLRARTRVSDVAVPLSMVATARLDERILDVVERVGQGLLPVVLVLEAGDLVGILTLTDIQRATQIGGMNRGPASRESENRV
ncbi:MAG: site-2 protease family protein [Actinobacteria bacterium]|nr:site-2 protease family protein [Actinomycetota bacterium]